MTTPTVTHEADHYPTELDATVANWMAAGWRVESSSPQCVAMTSGKPVNHILHLILSLVACGLWLPIWLIIAASTGVRRQVLRAAPDGHVIVGEVQKSGAQGTARILLYVAAALIALMLIMGIVGNLGDAR